MAKDYVWKDYYIEHGNLCKDDLDESKHFVHRLGGVPCVDAYRVWDRRYPRHITGEIRFTTRRGLVYHISALVFDRHKNTLDDGWGVQYWVPLGLWTVENPNQTKLAL